MVISTTRANRRPVEVNAPARLETGTIVKDTAHGRVGTIFDYGSDRDGTALYYLRATHDEFEAEPGSELEWTCDAGMVIQLTGWPGQPS